MTLSNSRDHALSLHIAIAGSELRLGVVLGAAAGDVKLLKHRETGKIRLLMRRDKTLKIVANHYIKTDDKGTFNLKEHPSSDKSWTYTAQDFSEGQTELTTFAIRFADAESAFAILKLGSACNVLCAMCLARLYRRFAPVLSRQ